MRKEVENKNADGGSPSRRQFLKLAATGAGAAAGMGLLAGKGAQAQEAGVQGDIDILNFGLTIEYFESEVFYPAALEAGILDDEATVLVEQLRDIEVQHRDALIETIESLGGTPIERPEYTVPEDVLADQTTFLQTALQQEITDVGALLGAAPMISSPDVLAAAGAIAGSEGENVVALKNILGEVPPANEAFPAAFTQAEVEAALAPFLGMGATMDTGGQAPVYGTGKAF